MLIQVHVSGLQAESKVRSSVRRQLARGLSKFQRHVQDVQVKLADVNGPRGGIDKQCRCVVQFNGISSLVVEDQDASVRRLVDRMTRRVAHAVGRRVDKRARSRSSSSLDDWQSH
ncbi:MAG: hypothetical protein AAGJ40_23590 [Planctomycetota bacterium]